ncbi:helix-turn-helix transcriptional regulator [Bartonella sp. LJL80]
MNTPSFKFPPQYMSTPQAAHYLGVSPRTLEKYRITGQGPLFYKIGRRVVYTIEDLEVWISQPHLRTAEYQASQKEGAEICAIADQKS